MVLRNRKDRTNLIWRRLADTAIYTSIHLAGDSVYGCRDSSTGNRRRNRLLFSDFRFNRLTTSRKRIPNRTLKMLRASVVNRMDETPFFEFNLEDFDKADADELKKFSKSSFDLSNILSNARELKYAKKIQRHLSAEIDPQTRLFLFA